MKPLIVLLVAFLLALACIRLLNGTIDYKFAGRIAMSVMLLFTSVGHFAFTAGMVMMMPDFLPAKKPIVILTGLMEIIAAVALQVPGWVDTVSWCLVAFFVLLLPANIHAAIKQVDYQKANYNGPGMRYLWFRVPLQLFFILWVYFSGPATW